MNDKDFIAEARRRTPTARINTGTGKLLEESLQRLEASIKNHTPAQDKPSPPCQSQPS